MARGPLRRGQLIAPFGVGAMNVLRDGTSVIACGIDHWFSQESDPSGKDVKVNQFKVTEWRLERLLEVNHFRLPPDYRKPIRGQPNINVYLTVPFLRFPQWHFCPQCHLLKRAKLSCRERVRCPECEANERFRIMWQVPIVAMCDHGHITDFPWNEWVHKSSNPSCQGPLRLIGTGGASLSAQKVRCDAENCKLERTLESVTSAADDGNSSYLTKSLERGVPYCCTGAKPWLHLQGDNSCGRPLRGTLRSASNVYFAQVESAIFLPRASELVSEELRERLEDIGIRTTIELYQRLGEVPEPDELQDKYPALLDPFSIEELRAGIELVTAQPKPRESAADPLDEFRFDEYCELLKTHQTRDLTTRVLSATEYNSDLLGNFFDRIVLVERLRETRALAGFTRILPHNDLLPNERRALLRRTTPAKDKDNWLPAYVVYGEGIFFEFREEALREWILNYPQVEDRVGKLALNFQRLQARGGNRQVSARFVLIHTFSHLLMNQLAFECGYSSAALKERLYVSESTNSTMAGVLIYTAAGDAEGTLGGLVRMGKPGNLEPVVNRAIQNATWCSGDPVCMEAGEVGGQGPESPNLSACHNCALVPETACEEFNRFVDRGVVIGDPSKPEKEGRYGFFCSALRY